MNTINVRTCFEGLHCWPDAPEQVGFLRNLHRHVFNIEVTIKVGRRDRDVEFFMLKAEIDANLSCVGGTYHQNMPSLRDLGSASCEMLATNLANHLTVDRGYTVLKVVVREDDENAGIFEALRG